MNSTNSALVNLSYLQSVSGGNREFEKMLLTGAIQDIDQQTNILYKSCVTKNTDAFYKAAHILKSVTAIVGLNAMQQCCLKIEKFSADIIFHEEGQDIYNQISNYWLLGKEELHQIISKY